MMRKKEVGAFIDMETKEIKSRYLEALAGWFVYECFIPILCIVAAWPIATHLLKLNFSFERIFSSVDLIPIGAVLIWTVRREITTEAKLNRISKSFPLFSLGCNFFAIVALFFYLPLKYYYLTFTFDATLTDYDKLDSVIKYSPYIAISIISFAIAYSFLIKALIIRDLK